MKSSIIFLVLLVLVSFHQIIAGKSVKKGFRLKREANHEVAGEYVVGKPNYEVPLKTPSNPYQQLKPHYPTPPPPAPVVAPPVVEEYEHKTEVLLPVQHYQSYQSPYFSPYNEQITGSPSGLNTYYNTDAGHPSTSYGHNPPYITEGYKKAGSLYLLEVEHSVNNDYATHDFCAEACRFRAIGGSRNIHMGLSPLGTESDSSCVCTCPVPTKTQAQLHPKLCSEHPPPSIPRTYPIEEYHGEEDSGDFYTQDEEYSRRRRNHVYPAVEEPGKVYPQVEPRPPNFEEIEEYPIPETDEEYGHYSDHFNYEDEYYDLHCDEFCQGRAESKPRDILGQHTAYFSGSCVSGQCVCACSVYSKPFENENYEHDYLPYHHP